MAIALSHSGTNVYRSESRSDEILVGTLEGVAILGRVAGGSGWEVVHRALPGSFVSSIIQEPESGLLFAGAFGEGGVFVSADDGRTWERRDDGVEEKDVYTVAAAKVNGKVRVFAGTQPANLYYSDDLGRSWSGLASLRSVPSVEQWYFPGPPHIAHVKQISFDPTDSNTMYIAVEVGALLKSTDGGQTWEELTLPDKDLHRTVVHPAKPQRVLAVCGGGGATATPGLHISEDQGRSWEQLTALDDPIGDYPDQLVASPDNADLMIISAAHHNPGEWRDSHSAGSRISRTEDGGRTWEVLTAGLPDRLQASVEAMTFEAYGDSYSVFCATTAGEVIASEDGGETWSVIVEGLAPVSKNDHYVPLAV